MLVEVFSKSNGSTILRHKELSEAGNCLKECTKGYEGGWGLEELSFKERLRDLGLSSLEKTSILSMLINKELEPAGWSQRSGKT